jgi:predicted permease
MNLAQDFRLAGRAMARRPGVTALAVASLALATGFAAAAFSVLDAYALRELAVREPGRLVRLYVTGREGRPDLLNWPEYQAVAARARSFEGLVTESRQGPRVKLPDRDDFPITAGVSENYFDVLGVRAGQGQIFHPGQAPDGIAVITHRYWQEALGGDPRVIGRRLPVGGTLLEIQGVLAPGFTGTNRGLLVDLYVPPAVAFGSLALARPDDLRHADYEIVGRLRPGVNAQQARAEIEAILRDCERDGIAPAAGRRAALEPFTEGGGWSKIRANAVPLAIMALLILIAAANMVNLRLVDNEARRQEVAIRLALGAGPGALARQHLAETLAVAAAGTLAGLMVAAWLIRLAPSLLYAGVRYIDYDIRLDGRTFAFSAGALVLVATAGALIPLSDAWKRRLGARLHGARGTRVSRWMGALVVAQMALVTGATCSAALLWRSFENVSAIRPVMDPDRKLLLLAGGFRLNSAGEAAVHAGSLARGLSGLPGVRQVAWARRAPLSGSGGGAATELEMPGQPKLSFRYNQVSPNYFAATGGRILSGRAFAEADGPAATPVVIVNQAFVRRFLADREPLGEWIAVAGRRQIVGVVEDGPANHLKEQIEPYFFFPFAQMPRGECTFFLQSANDPATLAAAARRLVRSADAAYTLVDTVPMRLHMKNARSEELLAAEVAGALSGAGLLLAAAGLFGVSLFAVARRTPEFGIRVAMGATPRRLIGQVLREAALRVAVAVPLGWTLAWAGRKALAGMLYGIAADDPWTLAIAGGIVALAGLAAVIHPALRAARIDPVIALRQE